MGVPGLFRCALHSTYSPLAKTSECDVLGIDGNVVLHTVADTCSQDTTPESFAVILQAHIDSIVQYFAPTLRILVCFDGVPPRAKILEQRARRIHRAHADGFNRNHFSPGTPFMSHISSTMQTHLCKTYPNRAIFSGVSVPGEGEHKLLSLCRSFQDNAIVVVSNDADVAVIAGNRFPRFTYAIRPECVSFASISGVVNIASRWENLPGGAVNALEWIHVFGNDFMPAMGFHNLYVQRSFDRMLTLLTALDTPTPSVWLENSASLATFTSTVLPALVHLESSEMHRLAACPFLEEKAILQKAIASCPFNSFEAVKKYCQSIQVDAVPVATRTLVIDYLTTWKWVLQYYNGDAVSMDWVFAHPRAPFWYEVALVLETEDQRTSALAELQRHLVEGNRDVRMDRTLHAMIVTPLASNQVLPEEWQPTHESVQAAFAEVSDSLHTHCVHEYQRRPSLTRKHREALVDACNHSIL